MLEVAVIGAGTSGLVAARHLLGAGLRPTIFEAAKTVGGAWTPHPSALAPNNDAGDRHPAGKMWRGLRTNLSKYTCRFSDWPWPDDASTFPTAEEMHSYLEGYSEHFLAKSPGLECRVTSVEPSPSSDEANYKVEWTDLNAQTTHSRDFGGVVVATGFFHAPRWPSFLQNRIGEANNGRPQLMHSSEYRTPAPFRGKNVAVIGSSFSALEIASECATTAERVVNVAPSVPWVLPRWVATMQPLQSDAEERSDDEALTILPADLALYQRSTAYPQTPETISLTPEACRKRHRFLQSLIGAKQRDSALGEPSEWDKPAFVAISDEYLDLVREKRIEVVHGRFAGVGDDGTVQIGAKASSDEEQSSSTVLDGIDHVVFCTGFAPQLYDFLSSDILSTIDYDAKDCFCPMTLAWDTLHPSLPGLAFCGMYRGPYMGVMELQARLAAGVLSDKLALREEQYQSALENSRCIRASDPRAQFPHFDYPGFMDTLSELCFPGEAPKHSIGEGDAVVPTFYQTDDKLSESCQSEIQQEMQCGQDGSRMPKVVLQSILGKWSFDRNIIHLQTKKAERVYGTVKFSKYWERDAPHEEDETTDPKHNPVLYREDGVYEFTPTQKFDVFREYEYEVGHDTLEIFFVEGGKRAHLFLSLKFVPETTEDASSSDGGHWVTATSDHLCIKDLYSATFRVKLNGLTASEIVIKYRVKGPAKDYESTTILKPQIT
ncbi:hypothetical protein ACHAXT_000602 [Thalassiosira profunda]